MTARTTKTSARGTTPRGTAFLAACLQREVGSAPALVDTRGLQ